MNENIKRSYWIAPEHDSKVKRALSSLSKKEHRKVTESEIIRTLIDKHL